jgi:hypothetical protein
VSAEREHADAGPSSSKQWMLCPASVTLSRGKPRKSSIFAQEGTAAHEVAELLIKGEPVPPYIEVEGEQIAVTEDMLDYVAPYVAFADMTEATASFFAVEQRVSLEAYFPMNRMPEPVFGTADMISYHEATRKLTVADFKYGKGVKVDAKGNTQGRTYALGAAALLAAKGFLLLNEIEILIFQPRVSPDPSKETLSRVELITWFENELKPAIARIGAGDTTENPGECQFCPRIGECRSVGRKAIEESRLAFDDGKVGGVVVPEMSSLSNEEIGAILSKAEIIENWIKGLRAEASTRIDAGQSVPGWKLVPKRAQRKWKDEEDAAKTFLKRGMTKAEVYETELRSPAGMEKVLKASGMTKEGIALVLKDLVVKESSGTTLVEDSDSRPAVSLASIFDAAPAPLLIGGAPVDDVL